VHSTNNFSKYFTVAVNNTRPWNMNVAIPNNRQTNDVTNHHIICIKVNISKADVHSKKPVRNTKVCNCWGSLRSVLVVVHSGCT
jgi:hypothetical protein